MSVYGYIRVSTDRQANDGESLEVQRRQIEGWCMMQGLSLAAEPFQDEGISGSIPIGERPAGAALVAALKPGDIIVAAKLDRMFRSALDALQTVDRLKVRKVKLHLLDLGEVTSNGMAKAFLTMASAFAELERDMIRERVTNTKRDQRARGRFLGGYQPFGYRKTDEGELVQNPDEQKVIGTVRKLRAAGKTFRSVQETIEQTYGRRLALATLARIARPELTELAAKQTLGTSSHGQ